MRKIILCTFLAFIAISITTVEVYAGGRKSTGTYKPYKSGKAIDGDTFRYERKRYRVQQYNAPEIGQPGAQKATRSLQRKIDSRNYEWKPVTTDVYGRTIVKEKRK